MLDDETIPHRTIIVHMAKIDAGMFRVAPGETVKLDQRATSASGIYESKDQYRKMLDQHVEELSQLQTLLYASNRNALLVIFQGMDAAGKDGAIKHVMSGVNPQGVQVESFKHPSAEELEHDFLWRTTVRLPERGRIGIFNRSYYEEVLVVRVHPEILRAENIPDELLDNKNLWQKRYQSINALEDHLHRNGTRVVKFFLHLSREEQRKRFVKRLDDPSRNWKFSSSDLAERKFWNDYMDAYGACLSATSSRHAPWYIVPADDKKAARLIVSEVILDVLRGLKMTLPEPSEARRKELAELRKQLDSEPKETPANGPKSPSPEQTPT